MRELSRSLTATALAVTALACGSTTAPGSREPGDRPNFVLVFIDDMGYGDIGAFGSRENRTPRISTLR